MGNLGAKRRRVVNIEGAEAEIPHLNSTFVLKFRNSQVRSEKAPRPLLQGERGWGEGGLASGSERKIAREHERQLIFEVKPLLR